MYQKSGGSRISRSGASTSDRVGFEKNVKTGAPLDPSMHIIICRFCIELVSKFLVSKKFYWRYFQI